MKHTITTLVGGKPLLDHLKERRPFENYEDQPDAAERKRREMQTIPFGLPEKKKPTHEERVESWKALLMMISALPEKRDE